jgi:minor histocompatibility antigen H13
LLTSIDPSPYMLGVATAVDAPMVLTFETETPMGGGGETSVHKSMLGLGDILFPGLLTVFALRFDLHLHWAAKMRVEQLAQRVAGGSGAAVGPEAPVGAEAAVGPPAAAGTTPPPATTPPSTPAAALPRAIRATFVPPSGLWGDRAIEAAWHVLARLGYNDATSPFVGRRLLPRRMRETLFAKRYFWAAMAGYAVGLAITIAVMITWHHGQPALFYLVPCVLSSQWLLAWWRGELAMLWAYTEDGSLDVEGVLVEVDEAGHKILRAPTRAGVVEGAATQADEKKDEKDDNKDDRDHKTQDGDASAKAADARVLFHLRLLAPEGDDEDEDDGGFEEYEVLKDAATTGSAAAGGAAAAGDGPDDGDARDAHDAAAASGASSSDWSISEGELED